MQLRKRVSTVLTVLCLLGISGVAQAASDDDLQALKARIEALESKQKDQGGGSGSGAAWTDKIKLGLHVRARNEARFNFDRNEDVGDKDDFTLLRGRFSIDARGNDQVRAYFQIQASRVFGDSCLGGTPTQACPLNGPFGPGNDVLGVTADDEDLSVHQAFVDLSSGSLTFRVGRQEMKFGDERLVGSLEWNNRARSFDGASLIFDNEEYRSQVFFDVIEYRPPTYQLPAPAPAEMRSDSYFTGFYNTLKKVGNGVDFYYLVFLDSDGTTVPSPVEDGNLFIHTLGLRTKDMPAEGLGYDLEGAVQGGENDKKSIRAFAGHVVVGYGLGGEWSPAVSAEYDIASGEEGKGDDNAFKNLFPTNHGKYGAIDFVSWSNVHVLRGGVSCKPAQDLSLAANFYAFYAYKDRGAIGTIPTLSNTLSPTRTSNSYGKELDLLFNYTFAKYAKLHGGYTWFLPGGMFKQSGLMHDSVHYAYAQIAADIP